MKTQLDEPDAAGFGVDGNVANTQRIAAVEPTVMERRRGQRHIVKMRAIPVKHVAEEDAP
jgi:hypothetical protein